MTFPVRSLVALVGGSLLVSIAGAALPRPHSTKKPVKTAAKRVKAPAPIATAAAPRWEKMPLLPPEAKKAGIFPGGEGCQWPRGPVVVGPSDPNFLLLPIDVGGLYRSLDGGAHWEAANIGWNARGANAFAIDPRNPKRVLGVAGNSMDYGATWGKSPHGVYLSTDKAGSWKQVHSALEGIGGTVAYDPSSFDAKRGYCTRAYFLSAKDGLFRSDDGGTTWKPVANTDATLGRVDRDWTQGGTILSLLKIDHRGTVYIGGGKGLARSTDNGKTWQAMRTNPVYGLDVTPSGAVYISGADGLQVAVSPHTGVFTPLAAQGVDRMGGKPIERVTVSPVNPDRMAVWVAGDNWKWVRYISHDGGKSFVEMKQEKGYAPMPMNARQGYFAWDTKNANRLYALGGDWVTLSTDGGRTFTWHNNGYNGVMVGGLFNFSPQAPKTVFLAFQDYNGAFTLDGGATWNYRDVSGKGWGGHCYGGYAVDSKTMFYGDAEGWGDPRRLRLTRDGGTTWEFVNGPDGKPLTMRGADVAISDPANPAHLFASNLRSGDGGKTWASMETCDAVFTSDLTSKQLYGAKGDALLASKDGGVTWSEISRVEGGIGDIAVAPGGATVYVASQEKLKRFQGGKWEEITTPPDQYGNTRVVSVAVDPKNGRIVYASGPRNIYASHATVVRSCDGGATWQNLTVNTPLGAGVTDGPHEVGAIRVHPTTRYAWAAGQCYGMWKIAPPASLTKGSFVAKVTAIKAPEPPKPFVVAVQNGDMEQGAAVPTSWDTKWGNADSITVSRDTKEFHGGKAALKVTGTAGGEGSAVQIVDATEGTKVNVSGWLKTEGGAKVNVGLMPFGDENGGGWKSFGFVQVKYQEGEAGWQNFSYPVTLPAGTRRIALMLMVQGDGAAWLDDLTLGGSNVKNMEVATPAASADVPPAVQDPIIAYPGYWADYPQAWLQTARDLKATAQKSNPKIVFLGDSITQGWGGEGRAEWDKRFAPLGAVNLGIGGDKTNQILWRVNDGTLDGLKPNLVVLKIGVNNLWNDQHGASRISEGVAQCVKAIRAKVPTAKILVLGILPTQEKADNGLRGKVKEINAQTAKIADNKTVFYRDLGPKMLEADGSLSKAIAPDFLHFSPAGYARFADALEPIVKELLR